MLLQKGEVFLKKSAQFLKGEGEVNYLFIAFFFVIYIGMFGTLLAVSTFSYKADRFVRELANRVSVVTSFKNRDSFAEQESIFKIERDRMLRMYELNDSLTKYMRDLKIAEVSLGSDYPHDCYRIFVGDNNQGIQTFLGKVKVNSMAYFFVRRYN